MVTKKSPGGCTGRSRPYSGESAFFTSSHAGFSYSVPDPLRLKEPDMLNINTVFRTPVIALLAWLLTGTTFFNDAYSAETVTVLTPYKHVVRRGQVSSQALSAVAQRDQYGYSDDWLSYLEFYPSDQ